MEEFFSWGGGGGYNTSTLHRKCERMFISLLLLHIRLASTLCVVDETKMKRKDTNLLHIQWSRVLIEKLTGSQLVKKFPAFYGTRSFITASTSTRHLSLSWASSNQPIPPHPTSWRSILILSSHLCLGLPSVIFASGFATQACINFSSPPYVLRGPPISFYLICSPEQYWVSSTDH